jgi:DNA-binding CsgD family transcriptional regulator
MSSGQTPTTEPTQRDHAAAEATRIDDGRHSSVDESGEVELTRLDQEELEYGTIDDPRTFNEVLGMAIVCGHLSYADSWWQQAESLVNEHRWLVDPVNSFALAVHERGESDDPAVREGIRRDAAASALNGPDWKLSVLTATAMRMNWQSDETVFINGVLSQAKSLRESHVSSGQAQERGPKPDGLWVALRKQAISALTGLSRRQPGYLEAKLHGIIGMSYAYTGEETLAFEHAATAETWALPRADRPILDDVWQARSAVALYQGDFEAAYAMLSELPAELSRWAESIWGVAELVDLADACEGVGRPQDALERIRFARTSGIGALSPRHEMLLSAAEAVIESDPDVAEPLFLRALALTDEAKAPFDLPRIRVLYARFLHRRRHDLFRARAQVRRALPDFDALGASGWVARANRDLESYQDTPRPPATTKLSRQERLIAAMAAEGQTNKQIAEKLFLSSRTVSYHLYNVFPKLGITSRAALRDALNGQVTTER